MKTKPKNIYKKGICHHCVEIGKVEEQKRILKIINTQQSKEFGKDDAEYVTLEELKVKIKGEK